MVNMAEQYRGPSPALLTLTQELRRDYGNPTRTYEFVTGYKSPSNVSSHNADNNGVAHAVDIFVGPGNLTESQGITVADQLRTEGTRGIIPGHPDRLAYIIHRGRIAGDHTGWVWVPYTGQDWHGDHIHVSGVFDYYWGDVAPGVDPSNYNSTIPWNLAAGIPTKPQGGGITTIKKDGFLMALTDAEQKELLTLARQSTPKLMWRTLIGRNGKFNTALQELADCKTELLTIRALATQLAEGQGVAIDYDRITADVKAALVAGVQIEGTITVGGTAE